MNLQSIYEPIREELRRVDSNLKGVAAEAASSLEKFLYYAVETRGKEIRPALTLLTGKCFSEDMEPIIVMATAVELLHIATLIHDDTVDKSNLRRGRPTVSSLWGKDVAVLVGDYAFARSATCVCDTHNIRVIRRFAETILALSSGELTELTKAYNWQQSRQDYLERIRNKTASLFSTAAECGAILGGASEEWPRRLSEYGLALGTAFQIVDDILDFKGSAEEAGKPVANDLLQGNSTLPAIILLEHYPEDNPIIKLFQKQEPEANLQRAIAMVLNSGAIEEAYAVARGFRDEAVSRLEGLPNHRIRTCMEGLAEYVMERRS